MDYKWPLATDSFTIWDRIKIAKFILNKNNQLTMGPKVREFEDKMSEFSGAKALAVSSGSAANTLIFELWKLKNPDKIKNTLVICPTVTWISSITPALMAGYQIEFCDINLTDFCFDYERLENVLEKNKDKHLIIWPTALIGWTPDFDKLNNLAKKYNAELFCDCAENTFGRFDGQSLLSQCVMTSTSAYFSHQLVSVEFGFVFFKSQEDYDLGRMLRNHGLTRSLEQNHPLRLEVEKNNSSIDKEFLFALGGTNLRATDVHAVFGLCDFERRFDYIKHRKDIYSWYVFKLTNPDYYLPPYWDKTKQIHIAFSLPIFIKDGSKLNRLKNTLNENGIQTRPIIGSNLLLQPPFQKYKAEVPNAQWLHEHGCYVGLPNNLKYKDIDKLVKILNGI